MAKIPSRSAIKNLEKVRKIKFCKKNREKLGKFSRMYFAIFDGFRPIGTIQIDQNMQFRDFLMIFCRKSMDSGPDFVQNHDFNRDFHKNLIFFENFLRNCLKFVYL